MEGALDGRDRVAGVFTGPATRSQNGGGSRFTTVRRASVVLFTDDGPFVVRVVALGDQDGSA